MSKFIKIKCPICEHEETFKYGYDYTDSKYNLFDLTNKNSLLSKITDKKIKERVKSFIKHGADIKDDYGFKIYICDKCNKISSEYDFTLIGYNEIYSEEHKCNTCHNELKELNFNKMFEYNCPKCKKNSLFYLNK